MRVRATRCTKESLQVARNNKEGGAEGFGKEKERVGFGEIVQRNKQKDTRAES